MRQLWKKLRKKISGKKRKLLFGFSLFVGLLNSKTIPASAQAENPNPIERIVRQEINVVYKFKEHPQLIREFLKLDSAAQNDLDGLVAKLVSTPLDSHNGIKQVEGLKNVSRISSLNGCVVYFRQGHNTIEILGQSNSSNDQKVVTLLKYYGY